MEDSLSEDGLVERLRDGFENRFLDSPASTTKSLKAEFEELSFRPTISVILTTITSNFIAEKNEATVAFFLLLGENVVGLFGKLLLFIQMRTSEQIYIVKA